MSRKRFGLICLVLMLALAGVGGYLLWTVHQVPEFYKELMAAEIRPELRRSEAKKFTQHTLQLVDDVKEAKSWSHEFTQQQVNSWFIEELGSTNGKGKFADLLPPEAKDPRIKIDGNAVLIGFQYQHSRWNGVVSLRVRPWVPRPNRLALEISNVKAGTLRIPLDNVLKAIEKQLLSRGWIVRWRQNNGNEVLVVEFPADKTRSVLESVQVSGGKIRVTGRNPDEKK